MPLTDDRELTKNDLTPLEKPEELVNFFNGLGYEVSGNRKIDHTAINLDTDNLKQQVQLIWKIAADSRDEDILVVLLKVRSAAVSVIQSVTQRLGQLSASFLVVLTTDYEKLNFVLVDKVRQEGKSVGSLPKYVVRPRTLTVNRRNPGPVALRVLKRFTFTEPDALYQWDKLRSAYTLAEWSEPDFNNRALFSDYYLKHRLTDNPAWAENVVGVWRDVQQYLVGARTKLGHGNEQQTRQALIEPLFKRMGFAYTAGKAGASDAEKPDYYLYGPHDQTKPLALALAYQWNRNLDAPDPRDQNTPNENPGALVVSLLEKAEAPWAIVTNGKLWRLYLATASNKITNYYEIDLEEALFTPERDREQAFKYWWLLFRREAFTGLLETILTGSQQYAKYIGEELKGRIFKSIFNNFAGGFIQYMRDQRIADNDIDLNQVFNATMTFLYRLMFVLYAESLELVPVKEENGYGAISLKMMKTAIARAGGTILDEADGKLDDEYSDDSTALYDRLRELFSYIETGKAELNLPLYNGGLFSSEGESGAFLAQYAIPDVYLAIGLDRLARDVDDKTHELVFIDFKSLGVRQLGSIYEGLLEFKLRIAEENLAVIKDGKREIYMPHAKAVKDKKNILDVVKTGQVYIENTKQERKATGSYYTPDYIVKYIVEHTVGPVLDEKFKALRSRLDAAMGTYYQHKKHTEAKNKSNPKVYEDPTKFWNSDQMRQLADDCLNIRVLDPAMGSGHFLVEVVDFVSSRLIDFLNGWSENPVWALLERTRADILGEMERQRVSVDEGKLTRVILLKRAVLKRCVYGVDLNAMAVELAKVSLWLDAFTLGAPLSFLDHHLKCGNSLIGARITEVQDYLSGGDGPQQMDMFSGSEFAGVMLATDLMRQVSYLSDNTVSQVKESRESFANASKHLAPYKRLLDVYTSRWFGNGAGVNGKSKGKADNVKLFLKQADVNPWLKDPRKSLDSRLIPATQIGQTALQAAADKRFFHWELEFPEVFFAPSTPGGQDVQLRKGGGFDAVVGNPPYISAPSMTVIMPDERSYLTEINDLLTMKWDIYCAFLDKEWKLLAPEGGLGVIVPNQFMYQDYAEPIRKLLAQTATIRDLIDLGRTIVFEDATVMTCVICTQKIVPEQLNEVSSAITQERHLTSLKNTPFFPVPQQLFVELPHNIYRLSLHTDAYTLIKRIIGISCDLGELCYGSVGVVPHSEKLNKPKEDFIYDRKVNQKCRMYIEGKDADRYVIDWDGRWLEYDYNVVRRPSLPELLETEKIVIKIVAGRTGLNASYDGTGLYTDHSFVLFARKSQLAHVTTRNLHFSNEDIQISSQFDLRTLLALVNSRPLGWVFNTYLSSDLNIGPDDAKRLPIRRIDFTTSADRRVQLAEKGRKLYERCLREGHACVLDFTAHHLSLNETDVIHDLLAFLAQQMIDLNMQKQSEVKRFLDWLEKTLHIRPDKDGKAGIDSLKRKSYIENYLGDYQKGEPETPFDDFYYWLHDNRTRFAVSLQALSGAIEDEYHKSLDALLPIKRQLATTDALIDRVVYQLYGLTDEEIKLIEYPQFEQAVTAAREDVLKEKDILPDEAIEKIAGKVEQAAEQYLARVDESQIEAQLRTEIRGWDSLPENVRKFLITGDLLLQQSTLPDYSPVVISFGKAAEAVLNARLFIPFRQTYSPADCVNSILQKFMTSTKTLSLGSMPIVLASNAEKALRGFVLKCYPNAAQTILSPKALLGQLTQDKIDKYRNSAAHDAVLTGDDAKEARQWAIEILGYV